MSTKQLASLMIKISANGAQAQKELSTLEAKVQDFGKSMQKVGSTMTKYVTLPLTALAGVAVKTANTQLQAEARLLTALKNRKDMQQRLIAQAQEIQKRTVYGDEAIIEQQAYLAALGLTEEQIRDTIEASVQLSSALGIELESAVKNLAKTYGGLTGELGESIPALKNLTAEQLKNGDAVDYVLENYKGFAEQAAKTGAGPLSQLKNKLGDVGEKIGTVLLPVLEKLANWLGKLADWFNNLPPGMQEMIVTLGAIAAAFGPLLLGIGKFIAIIPSLRLAMTTLTGPIGAVIALLTALTAGLISATNAMDDMKAQDEADFAAEEERAYQEALKEPGEMGRYYKVRNAKWRYEDNLAAYKKSNSQAGEKISPGEEYNLNMLMATWNGYNRAFWELVNARREQEKADKKLAEDAKQAAEEAEKKRQEEIAALGIIGKLQLRISELQEQMPFLRTAESIAKANDECAELNKQLEYYNNLTSEQMSMELQRAETMALKPISWGVSGVKNLGIIDVLASYGVDQWREQMIAKAQKMADVVNEMNSIISAALANMVSGIGNYLESLISGDEFKPLVALLSMIGETLKQLGSALVAYAVSLEAFKKAFSNPWVALAAGAAAIVAGSAVMGWAKRMEKTTKLATGGLAYGPTMAIVGDNPGASNDPEVIAPLSKLRDYMGGQKLELVGDISFELHGDRLKALLDRNNIRLATLG